MSPRSFVAHLLDATRIRVHCYQPPINQDIPSLRLRIGFDTLVPLKLSHVHDNGLTFDFTSDVIFQLGIAYMIVIESFGSQPLSLDALMLEPSFERQYTYAGDDLGANYGLAATTFKLWAPLATQVLLKLYEDDRITAIYIMDRADHGVYQSLVQGNLDGVAYRYEVTNYGQSVDTLDPYGIGSSRQARYSVVINLDKTAMPMHDEALPRFSRYTDAILYEAHVRDLSIDPHTNIQHKGRFLGMIEPNRKHKLGHAVGFDYIKNLGITHLQLLPVNDYRSVDEDHVDRDYNWGYDPYQYFAVEGSYASELDDPYSRIIDFKKVVASYHQIGIRINVDVVFNHVYEFQHSIFERVVPGYYFRKTEAGTMANGSFCGNDVATEKPMVRHLIVQAALSWVKLYHIDGYRFDLMGMIDRQTMQMIKEKIHTIRPDFMLYGEGWNMPTPLPQSEKCITEQSPILPYLAFFNDSFRNTVKGGNFEHDALEPGLATGHLGLLNSLPFLMHGSCLSVLHTPKVTYPHQSINYVECHDNGTFYDKLKQCNPRENLATYQARIILAHALVLLAQGVPFIHMGQEVAGTKYGHHNSYNAGDRYNQFDYARVHEHAYTLRAVQNLIAIRKQYPNLRDDHHRHLQDFPSAVIADQGWTVIINGKPKLRLIFNVSLDTLAIKPYQHGTLVFNGYQSVHVPVPESLPPLTVYIIELS